MNMVVFLDNYVLSCCDEGVVASLDNNNKYYFDVDFSFLTPWNKFLRVSWVVNV